jgi:hypothetical protein
MNRLKNLKRVAKRIDFVTGPTKSLSRRDQNGVHQFKLPPDLLGSSPVQIIEDTHQLGRECISKSSRRIIG